MPRWVDLAANPLALEQFEEAVGHGVVVAVAPPTHATDWQPFLAKNGPRLQAVTIRAVLGLDETTLAALPNVRVTSSIGVGLDKLPFQLRLRAASGWVAPCVERLRGRLGL